MSPEIFSPVPLADPENGFLFLSFFNLLLVVVCLRELNLVVLRISEVFLEKFDFIRRRCQVKKLVDVVLLLRSVLAAEENIEVNGVDELSICMALKDPTRLPLALTIHLELQPCCRFQSKRFELPLERELFGLFEAQSTDVGELLSVKSLELELFVHWVSLHGL